MKTDMKIVAIVGVLIFFGIVSNTKKKSVDTKEQEQISFCSSELAQTMSMINA